MMLFPAIKRDNTPYQYDFKLIGGMLIYFYVNMIFILKYNPLSVSSLWISIFYSAVVCCIFFLLKKLLKLPKWATILYFTGCAGILIVNVLLLHFIDYQSVNVDRASGLHNWNDYLLRGINPYLSQTHMEHNLSVFPVWAIFHLPFYGLGDVGYSQLFCLILLFVTLFLHFKSRSLLYIGLMAMSPAFWYHCAMRSDLLSNMFLAMIFMILLFRYPLLWQRHKLITAFTIGLLMCTRIFVIIPLFLFFWPYWLHFSWRDKILFVLLCLTGFIVPFIPFVIWGYEPLIASWSLQTTHGSGNAWAAIACFMLTIYAAFSLKTERQLFFWSSCILFAVTFFVSIETIINEGLKPFLFENLYDIAYYSACFPFLFYFLSMENNGYYIPYKILNPSEQNHANDLDKKTVPESY